MHLFQQNKSRNYPLFFFDTKKLSLLLLGFFFGDYFFANCLMYVLKLSSHAQIFVLSLNQ